MKTKMKHRSQRYVINRPRSRQGHEYSKYKKCLIKAMLVCIKQHLSKIWSLIYEKVKEYWGWAEKKCCVYRKACIS